MTIVPIHRRALALASAAALVATLSAAQVSTFEEVVGHRTGERITQHHQTVRYLEHLAAASPRVKIVDQGITWEKRPLPLAIVTSPENHARLDEIQATAQRLGDPRGLPAADAARLIERQPAVVWLGGSIHGFELSGTEGLLLLLEHLTTRDDPATRAALHNTVILVDVTLNPDGRDAFAHQNHQRIGHEPNPWREDWANDFTWWEALSFRTSHYFFDMNRDWFAHTHREIRARVPTLQAWRPQVVVDAHEMGPDVEFFFDPPTDPVGPFFPEFASRWLGRFGAAYARAFDEAGFEYTTRELYNYFYPAYTTSYGSYQGAVGMLYEQGSSRGLALELRDETIRTLAQAARQQYLAAWTAVEVAAEHREEFLRDYVESHRRAVADGERGVRRYLVAPGGDPALADELAALLARNGIEVGRLTAPVRLDGVRDRSGRSVGRQQLPAGSLVVEAAQPRNRLIRALLEPDVPVPEEFLEQARSRIERGENPRFYDLTAWSLPLLFNLDGYSATDGRSLPVEPVTAEARPHGALPPAADTYAYVLDGRHAAAAAAAFHLRHEGFRSRLLLDPTRVEGRDLASGSIVLRTQGQPEGLREAIGRLIERYGLEVAAFSTGLSEAGHPPLGTARGFWLKPARIALLAEDPVHAYSFGWAWFALDRQYGIPTTILRTRSIADTPLDRFDTLVLPDLFSDDRLAEILREAGLERLRRWVREGGTLVAVGNSVEFVRKHLELTALRSWYDEERTRLAQETRQDPEKVEPPQRFEVPGAILRGEVNSETWLAAGVPAELPLLVTSSRLFLEPSGPPAAGRRLAVRYASSDPVRLSGHVWPASLERIPGAVFAYEERIGGGRVIVLAEDVNFRGYWRGADRLFLNAVLLGPSAP